MEKKSAPGSSSGTPKKSTIGNRINNVFSKLMGLLGLGLLVYIAALIIAAVTIFFVKVLFVLFFTHSLFHADYFAKFRHHFSELVGYSIQANLYNVFIRPPMNALISICNAVLDPTKSVEHYTISDLKENASFMERLRHGVSRIGYTGLNLLIQFRNIFDMTRFKMDLYQKCSADDISQRKATERAPYTTAIAEPASWLQMGYHLIKGSVTAVIRFATAPVRILQHPGKSSSSPKPNESSTIVSSKVINRINESTPAVTSPSSLVPPPPTSLLGVGTKERSDVVLDNIADGLPPLPNMRGEAGPVTFSQGADLSSTGDKKKSAAAG